MLIDRGSTSTMILGMFHSSLVFFFLLLPNGNGGAGAGCICQHKAATEKLKLDHRRIVPHGKSKKKEKKKKKKKKRRNMIYFIHASDMGVCKVKKVKKKVENRNK